jgi:hypothetical protein
LFFDNTIEVFQKLLAITEALKLQQDLTKAVFGLEPTANYHKPLGEHLIECGHLVVLVAGGGSKAQPAASGWQMGQTRHQGFRKVEAKDLVVHNTGPIT